MAILTDELLQGTAARVFRQRETTLDEAAANLPMPDFAETLTALRERMRGSLVSLPDAAFTAQQAGEGEDVWAAGQIVAHLQNSLQQMGAHVDALLDRPAAEATLHDLGQLPTRDDALTLHDASSAALSAFMASIPPDADK